MMSRLRFFVLAFFLFFSFVLVTPTLAQDTSGIGLTPSLIEEGADPGEEIKKTIRVRNLSPVEQQYYLYVRDISGVQNGGAPVFSDNNLEKTGFELSEWVSLGTTELVLQPNEEAAVEVTIRVPDNASPGSHFGGVFVSKEPPRLRESGASIGYQVANIISIRVAGDAQVNALIRSLSTDKIVYGSTNVEFTGRVENKGNVLIRPTGPLQIYNMFGSQVANVQFNQQRSGVFPGTIRDFTLTWEDEGLGFGRYEANLSLIYGEQGMAQKTITGTVSFWILPMKIIKPAAIILAVLLIGSYLVVRLYIRRKVAQMSGGRRLVRRRQQQGPSTLLLVSIVMLAVTVIFLILLLALFA